MKNELVKSTVHNIPIAIRIPDLKIHTHAGLVCTQHFHDDIEFLYVLSGKFRCVSNGITYDANDGDIVFINSRVPHQTYHLEDDTQNVLFQFIPYSFSNDSVLGISRYLSRFINIDKEPVILFRSNAPESEELKLYLENIMQEYTAKQCSYELYIKANIYNILAFLSRQNILSDSSVFFDEKNIDKILPALMYIDKHYNEQITLDELSTLLNLNSSYLCRLFKKATNSTFVEYLNFVRICKSERLLAASKQTIGEISLDLGFASVSYFNKVFKKFKSCTPTEYRKSKYALQ